MFLSEFSVASGSRLGDSVMTAEKLNFCIEAFKVDLARVRLNLENLFTARTMQIPSIQHSES